MKYGRPFPWRKLMTSTATACLAAAGIAGVVSLSGAAAAQVARPEVSARCAVPLRVAEP